MKLLTLCLAVLACATPLLPARVRAPERAGRGNIEPASHPFVRSGPPQPLGVTGTWRLRFDDEFSGRSLDLHRWEPNWLGPSVSSVTPPVTRFDLNCVAPGEVRETHGVLALTAAPRTCSVGSGRYGYASGLINTARTFRFAYGYLEARIYIPGSPSGHPVDFPAFWATGSGPWPASGELDVMEALRGCGPGVGYHVHSSRGSSGGCAPAGDSTGWHVFGAHWERGRVIFYCDGEAIGAVTHGVPSRPLYLVLNNSVDPVYGAESAPSTVQVDYVRVWQ